ncbi:hypothetical protein EDD86DRAFT_190942 [Gorgonomyces haynaldii]|nr:hypothetical protein EDD86DRAFT_190942 [Gorgonomyces haynaldii]
MPNFSQQSKALFIRAVAYQKRQWLTNIACIFLCPLLMVAFAAGLGVIITNLVKKTVVLTEYTYCSNMTARTTSGVPIYSIGDLSKFKTLSNVPQAKTNQVYQLNIASITNSDDPRSPALANAGRFRRFCSYWYGDDHPYDSVYDPFPVYGPVSLDTSFLQKPNGSWFQELYVRGGDSYTVNRLFKANQQRFWAIYGADPSISPSLLGTRQQQPELSLNAFQRLNSTGFNASLGLFDNVDTKYFAELLVIPSQTQVLSVQPVPWFVKNVSSSKEIDDYISQQIDAVLKQAFALDSTPILTKNATATQLIYGQIDGFLKSVPSAGLYINKLDHTNRRYSFNIHVGLDQRIAASNFPSTGTRALYLQTILDNAILRSSTLNNYTITHGFRIMPYLGSNAVIIPLGGYIGDILYPFGVSFLIPVFSVVIVRDKESRILSLLKMNGVKPVMYYLWQYVAFYLFTFFSNSRLGLIVTFMITLCGVIISLTSLVLYPGVQQPTVFFLWPPFAFYRILTLLNEASYAKYRSGYQWSDFIPTDEVYVCVSYLAGAIPCYLLLSLYLDAVWPSTFGLRKPWYFIFTEPYEYYKQWKKGAVEPELDHLDHIVLNLPENEKYKEDADVIAEKERLNRSKLDLTEYPLVMKNMRKIYASRNGGPKKLAVKSVSFGVEPSSIFGLLGPNGSGKTTLISILTGLYPATAGQALIAGYDVSKHIDQVYRRIGVCPQFNVLWEDLSIDDHLYFYARLKGYNGKELDDAVQESLESVKLTPLRARLSRKLSGGEQRRLSIAIALLGTPSVVFLDEPTTGLDPEVRRQIWDIVQQASKTSSILLTTHSMEEAECLCHNIGIMAKGSLRCLGSPMRLKQLYGSGFKLFCNTDEKDTDRAKQFLESILPEGWTRVDAFATNTTYEFPVKKGVLANLFETIRNKQHDHGILDWGVGETTLEEIFVKLISEEDASHQ